MPGDHDSLGQTYDCNPCCKTTQPTVTIYSNAWSSDGEDESGNLAPSAVLYGCGVTESSDGSASLRVRTTLQAPDGGAQSMSTTQAQSYARADVSTTLNWNASPEGDYGVHSNHYVNGGSVGATSSPIVVSRYASRYRLIGKVGGYWEWGAHDCVHRCIKSAKYTNDRPFYTPLTYLDGRGWYIKLFFIVTCTGSCVEQNVPGQCWGPYYR